MPSCLHMSQMQAAAKKWCRLFSIDLGPPRGPDVPNNIYRRRGNDVLAQKIRHDEFVIWNDVLSF